MDPVGNFLVKYDSCLMRCFSEERAPSWMGFRSVVVCGAVRKCLDDNILKHLLSRNVHPLQVPRDGNKMS